MENISKLPFTKRSKELILILVLGFIFTLAASNYNLFESIVIFVENYDRESLGLLLVLAIYASFGMGIFSLRRWMELENALVLYREIEDSLKERDRVYRALFEQSNDAVIISDGKKVLDINKKGCEIFGFGQRHPLNTSLMSFIPGEYLPELQQALKETFKQETSQFEMRYQRPDGEIIDIEVNLSFINRKDNIIQIIAQDITDIRNAERWEQENRERLKTVLDNTLCGILLIEASSRKIVDANPVALKTTGYSENELIGMVCHQLIRQPGEECTVLSSDQAEDLSESILFKATGEPLPILRSIVPVSIRGTGYFVESFIDLSERKKTEEDLLQAKLAAEGANRAMSEFLTTMDHELRTSLTAIIGFSEFMLGETTGELDDLNKKFLGNISSSGKCLLSLINSILDLSKIEVGKMNLELDYFSFYDIFADIRSIISPLALKKNISMNFNVEPDLFIYADRTCLKQIMYNLLSNAIKFTPSGGSIEVLGSRSEKGVRVAVSDTGIGISKEDLSQLFRPFKQIDSSLNRKYEGAGLGLVLAKKFVEMHGGRIWVESEPGKGSTFAFEVPVKILKAGEKIGIPETCEKKEINFFENSDNAGETAEPETEGRTGNPEEKGLPVIFEPEGSDGSEPLVMVVEDDKLSRELLIFTLKEAGYRVAQAVTGKQALFLARKLKPFVITLDLMLPEMNGWDVFKNLKKGRETAGIPVLVFSIDDMGGCNMLWGAFDYLVKPVEKSILLSTLDHLKEKMKKEVPKILIVDDQETMVELIAPLVKEERYIISRAYGGKEAVEKVSTELPDAVILNLMMPDVSGFEVIRDLKKNPETVDIPIVICTAKDLSDTAKDLSEREMKMLNGNAPFVMKNEDFSFVVQREDLNKQTFLQLIKALEPEEENCKTCVFSSS